MLAQRQFVSWVWLIVAALPYIARADPAAQHEYELVLLSTPNMAHGAALFDTCAACHGPTGAGAPDGTVPAIAAQHFKVIARALVDYRHDMRHDERMEHFANAHHLKDAQDIADVAAYMNALAPAGSGSAQGPSGLEGAQVYARLCASCHGRNAQGDGALAIPRLAGQHDEYLLRQMHDVVDGRRPDYSPNHLIVFNRLQPAQFAGVAAYLAHIPVASPP